MAPPTPTTTPTTILLVSLKPLDVLLLLSFRDDAVGSDDAAVTVLVTTTVFPSVTDEKVVAKTLEEDEEEDREDEEECDDDNSELEVGSAELSVISLDSASDEEADEYTELDGSNEVEGASDDVEKVLRLTSSELEVKKTDRLVSVDREEETSSLLRKDEDVREEEEIEEENAEVVELDDSWLLLLPFWRSSLAIKPYFSANLATASPWGICNDWMHCKCQTRHARSTVDFMVDAKEGGWITTGKRT